MMSEINTHDTMETRDHGSFEYTNIKPETNMTPKEAREMWDAVASGRQEIGLGANEVKDSKADVDSGRDKREYEGENSEKNGLTSEKIHNKDIEREEGMSYKDSQNYWDEHLKSERGENNYYSTYSERISQTPAEDGGRGKWTGQRGESGFAPNDSDIKGILRQHGIDEITYKDGIPDFSKLSEATVGIKNMSENRAENFSQCDEKCAEHWNKENRNGRNDWTAREVKQWRKENGYSWHERNDMKTCDLIPTKINDYFGHLGGVAECKKRDSYLNGGDFDE